MDYLKKLLSHLEGGKTTSLVQPPSPFSNVVGEAPLPPGYRNTTDLHYDGDFDQASYLGKFNTNMNVYEVPDLTRCRLLAATLRDSGQPWFQKLGAGAITS